MRDAARAYTGEAIETLVRLMREAEKDEVRLRAAEVLIDRGWGRATQSITGEGGEGAIQVIIQKYQEP